MRCRSTYKVAGTVRWVYGWPVRCLFEEGHDGWCLTIYGMFVSHSKTPRT